MAVELHFSGSQAQVTSAINAMGPSNWPGQAAQLARVQAAAIAEVAAFGVRTNYHVDVTCHRDSIVSTIHIQVAPVQLGSTGAIQTPMATGNDNEL
jgi:hypothetical protein